MGWVTPKSASRNGRTFRPPRAMTSPKLQPARTGGKKMDKALEDAFKLVLDFASAYNSRGNGSEVGTKKPPYRVNEYVPRSASGDSMTRYREYKKASYMKKILKDLSPTQNYQALEAYRSTSAINEQKVAASIMMIQKNDLGTLTSLVGTNPTTQFYLDGVTQYATFTNMSNALLNLDIYEVLCRTQTSQGPEDAFKEGLKDEGGGTTATNNYGVVPYQSKRFCQQYKIRKRYHVEIPEGGSHRHISSYRINKYWTTAKFDSTESDVYQAYWTRGIMYVHYGQPTNDQTTPTQVGIGPTALDLIIKRDYSFRYMTPVTVSYSRTYGFGTVTTPVEFDKGSGQKTTITTG